MSDNQFTATPAPAALDYDAIAKATPEIVSGAKWFWWIVGLSLVNSVIAHTGGNTSFVMGLGFTQVADAMFESFKPVALAIDLLILGFFFAMGWFGSKGRQWAFITGIVVYSLDTLIYLAFQDWMPVGFHGLALFYIVRALLKLREAIKAALVPPAAPPIITPIAGV